MLISLAAVVVAFLASWILTPLVRVTARRRGLLDEPADRKIHDVAIPRLGGIAIAIALFVGVAVGLVVQSLQAGPPPPSHQVLVILLGCALVAIVGVLDDLVGMRARTKLAAQIAVALLVVLLGLSIKVVDGPWGTIELGAWSVPITALWFVVVMNAVNLIDGLDGLASGVALTAMASLYLIGTAGEAQPQIALILAAAAGGVLGFLPYNIFPATIIMGDTGAILLGFVLAAAGVSVTQSGMPGAAPWAPVAALGVALADTVWAIVRRGVSGAPIFAPDKRHIHHRLVAAGLSQRRAVLLLWLASAALGLTAVLTAR